MRYNKSMVEIVIGKNEEGQRLDRFLRKYLPEAPLSHIYRIIRKDVKVNGKRVKDDHDLDEGDVISLYLTEEEVRGLRGSRGEEKARSVRKTFRISYEDDDILICDKPAGLLTHGDKTEKSNHLTNQVQGYLMGKGDFDPASEKTFSPSPVNRIDRNTTGLVIFAKNYDALKKLNSLIRNRKKIRKYYLTVVSGMIKEDVTLTGSIEKDEARNVSRMTENEDSESAKLAVTHVKPVLTGRIPGIPGMQVKGAPAGGRNSTAGNKGSRKNDKPDGFFTVAEVEIETGRTHQIRVQLAEAGHPLAGDPKYGDPQVNKALRDRFGLSHQLLTAWKLEFGDLEEEFPDISGKTVHAKLPKDFDQIKAAIQKSTKKSMGKGKRA